METVSVPQEVLSQQPLDTSANSVPNQNETSEKQQAKALLAEARNTRDMLVGFRSAVESGSYHGAKMMDLAKGMAFLEAILSQNNNHIKNLQVKLDGK